MRTQEAVNIFGSTRRLCETLGISRQAVFKWGGTVPPLRVYQIREIQSRALAEKIAA